MKLSILKITLIFCVVATTAYNNIKNNASYPVFENFSPTSKEYKNELANLLKTNPTELQYTFKGLIEKEGREYLNIDIEGGDFTASSLVLVNNWEKLEGIKSTKGMSYAGAELKGLKLAIEENSSGANLVYNDLEKIID